MILASFLKYTDPSQAIRKHVDSEDKSSLSSVLSGCREIHPENYTPNELSSTYIHEALSSQRVAENHELFCIPLDRLYEFVRDIVDADRQIIALGNMHIHATYTSIIHKGAAAETRITELKAEEKAKSDAKIPSLTNLRAAGDNLLDTFACKVI